eukprot:191643-Alexandrium_andersonii.AAC.1
MQLGLFGDRAANGQPAQPSASDEAQSGSQHREVGSEPPGRGDGRHGPGVDGQPADNLCLTVGSEEQRLSVIPVCDDGSHLAIPLLQRL